MNTEQDLMALVAVARGDVAIRDHRAELTQIPGAVAKIDA